MNKSRASSNPGAWSEVERTWSALDDQRLADAILEHAAARRVGGEPPRLRDYLEAVPDLRERPVPLDAAIEAVVGSGRSREPPGMSGIEALVRDHPDLESSIRDCVTLNTALCSTFELEALIRDRRPPPDSVGPRLADGQRRYKLLRPLGTGSSGAVFEADDRLLSDGAVKLLVAVKVLDHFATDMSAALWEEAAKASRVKHPNVIRALDRGVSDDGHRYAVFELAAGGDLATFVAERGRLHWRRSADLAAQIARGVHASHQAGLIHADIKPQNVLMR